MASVIVVLGIILLKAVGRVVQQMLYFEAEKTQGKS